MDGHYVLRVRIGAHRGMVTMVPILGRITFPPGRWPSPGHQARSRTDVSAPIRQITRDPPFSFSLILIASFDVLLFFISPST